MSARTVLILSCTLISAATLFVATAQEASVDLTMFAIDHPAIQYT